MILSIKNFFKPIPCKNCITLSVCKASLNGGNIASLIRLTQKCSLFKEYVVGETMEYTVRMTNHAPITIQKDLYNERRYRRIVSFLIRDINFSKEAKDLSPNDGLTIAGIQDTAEIAYILKSLKLNNDYKFISKLTSSLGIKPIFPPPPPPRKYYE